MDRGGVRGWVRWPPASGSFPWRRVPGSLLFQVARVFGLAGTRGDRCAVAGTCSRGCWRLLSGVAGDLGRHSRHVVSGYFSAAVTRHRPVWIGLLLGGRCRDGGAGVAAAVAVGPGHVPGALGARRRCPRSRAGWTAGSWREVVSALTAAGSGPVALTTGLVGAGGFGKTTLAAKACQDRRGAAAVPGRDRVGHGRPGHRRPGAGRQDQRGDRDRGQAAGRRSPARSRRAMRWPGRWRGGAGRCWSWMTCGRPLSCSRSLAAGQSWQAAGDHEAAGGAGTTSRARRIKVDAMPDAVARRLLTRGLPVMVRWSGAGPAWT